ncbi:EscU/YscU/HrcU family type III secretion system export apparatus switch protein [Microbulbifer sediminum]|uniref:EscU/YscU/HrcU family type III secretion system export apparatus switch protein n=1 Tax=Microbulbifer sediminum TaxID=2904250 RepID=UPI001F4800AD|nr:EscU/YscU/HrcU family type III secretion system export apparatus switch protein [Microbulbifer sediminum]
MASEEQEQDRSEPATPYKLEQARQRGQVAKSVEVNAWVILAICSMVVFGLFDALVSNYLRASQFYLANSGSIPLNGNNAVLLLQKVFDDLLFVFAPVIGAIVIAALAASFMQVGAIFSWHPLKPDVKRLNPAQGFKRIFNKKIIYELIKTSIKISIVACLVWVAVVTTIDQIFQLRSAGVGHQVKELAAIGFVWVALVLAGLGAIAVIDLVYTRWEYKDNMRMSRREIKEEVKRRDGDPKVKAKIKELQREAAKKGLSLANVPDADVLITNPTHISVAIKYQRALMPAPIVTAKGAGDLALKMRIKATQSGVPIVESRELARLLYRESQLQDPIPPETFPDIARILVDVMRKKGEADS